MKPMRSPAVLFALALLCRACSPWELEVPWSSAGAWRAPRPRCAKTQNQKGCECNWPNGAASWRPTEGPFLAAFSPREARRTCGAHTVERVLFVGDSLAAQMRDAYEVSVGAACSFRGRPPRRPAIYARCWDPQPTHAVYMLCDGCRGYDASRKKECTFAGVIDTAHPRGVVEFTTVVVSYGAHLTTPQRLGLTSAYSTQLDALDGAVRRFNVENATKAVRALEHLYVEGRVVDSTDTKTLSIARDLAAAAARVEQRARERNWTVLLADAPPGHVGCFGVRAFNATLSADTRAAWLDLATQYKFGWHAIPTINAMAHAAFKLAFATSPAPLACLAAFEAFAGHVQAHPSSTGMQLGGGAKDCLHYCGKGPLHVYPELIHNALLALGPVQYRFNRSNSTHRRW
ncbi:hypothetical protein M885DRAFT_524824 [Pelagophyceae sp. CCMP2097]|nr:hypothetical protein M885DRAFT_524824 [Pelagophyceae sp. CCMP2097]